MYSTYSKNDSFKMKKHLESQKYDYNIIANHATSDIFIVLINYLQDIMIIIFNNNL